MSDWMLLYLFTRLDAARVAVGMVAFASASTFIAMAFATISAKDDISIYHDASWPDGKLKFKRAEETLPRRLRFMKQAAVTFFIAVCVMALLPSKVDMAVIVGGKIALDAGRSDTAKEVGREVLDAVRAQLKKAAQ